MRECVKGGWRAGLNQNDSNESQRAGVDDDEFLNRVSSPGRVPSGARFRGGQCQGTGEWSLPGRKMMIARRKVRAGI